jgi:hypothetical protein
MSEKYAKIGLGRKFILWLMGLGVVLSIGGIIISSIFLFFANLRALFLQEFLLIIGICAITSYLFYKGYGWLNKKWK